VTRGAALCIADRWLYAGGQKVELVKLIMAVAVVALVLWATLGGRDKNDKEGIK
jgi:hypothetical protein